jgi:gliding motility-associated-like protein
VGVPKFYSNGDGYNDYWNVKGLSANFNGNSIIYIFNRFGKLLKQIIQIKDGMVLYSQPLPSDDYWYTVKLEDGRGKRSFSLKR